MKLRSSKIEKLCVELTKQPAEDPKRDTLADTIEILHLIQDSKTLPHVKAELLKEPKIGISDKDNVAELVDEIVRVKKLSRKDSSGAGGILKIKESLSRTISKSLSKKEGIEGDVAEGVTGKGQVSSASHPIHDSDHSIPGILTTHLQRIAYVSELSAEINKLMTVKVDRSVPEHEQLLQKFRQTLQRTEVGDPDWGYLGFQGKNPETDFRGGGLLSLQILVHFAVHRTSSAKRMLEQAYPNELARYPFACCGISFVVHIGGCLKDRLLDHALYKIRLDNAAAGKGPQEQNETCKEAFIDLICDAFEMFHDVYVSANPRDVMDYPPIYDRFLNKLKAYLKQSSSGTFVLDKMKLAV